MSEIKNGGPAFPRVIDPDYKSEQGMTLRDYFAAKAMAAFLTASGINKAGIPGVNNFEEVIAKNAYVIADAMLTFRGRS